MAKRLFITLTLLCLGLTATAQRFFNLTSDEVTVDTVLPRFTYSVPLTGAFQDSVYASTILYPEFIDMTPTDLANYRRLSTDSLPTLPTITQQLVLSRKAGELNVSFCPLVWRDGHYQILVSFMLRVDSRPLSRSARRQAALTRATAKASRYVDHSVLATGQWAKISVPSTGVYELTPALIRQAGFTNINKVKVYGYGGNLQNETLTAEDLQRLDDLQEVPTCTVGGHRLFYARGPVSWTDSTATRRTRNPYSTVGCYFITESDAEPAVLDSAAFLASFYPAADDYHALYEVDGYSWYHGGRNLFDTEAISNGSTKTVVLPNRSVATTATAHRAITVNVSAGTASSVEVLVNGTVVGDLQISLGDYDKGNESGNTYDIDGTPVAADTVTIRCTAGGPVRLDYAAATWGTPAPAPTLTATFPEPTYVYNITNQDHHADGAADMVIIIPTSQKLLAQAQRLAAFHEQHDSLRVRIVPADELYNEFSSGTPDANAYRRYLKMLYDRAETDADMPRYLLLFGDCVWDNRMLTSACRNLNADDYLLCFESENSFNEVTCYVDDGWFCLLDDGEGANPQTADKLDMAVGRFPVVTADEAKVMVDKTIAYVENQNAGAWQNTLMFLGDDGNQNTHMRDVNATADDIAARYPGYLIKKVMWDAYTGETSSTGNSYPEVSSIIRQQQAAGALVIDYAGHGREDQISHETVLKLKDFEGFTNKNLPLWVTASCDIMPFDNNSSTIGEAAVLNANGGAVAFFGTTRTVYSNYNKVINQAFMRYVLSMDNGRPMTLGEAQRQAKNYMITSGQDRTTNKLQYALLGDPAISLNLPTLSVVIDSINGQSLTDANATEPTLKAGSTARFAGHIVGQPAFRGTMTATVRDTRELITCKLNASATVNDDAWTTTTPFTFYDRTKTLFSGTDSVQQGKFSFSFTVPMDINYADASGQITIHAVSSDKQLAAHGEADDFLVGGSAINATDAVGPKIYCYLNTPEFQNGGEVNVTPYFVAQLSDASGINATGNGIGHDMQLIIDGDATRTYTLNDNFQYDFGTSTSGSTYYNIPTLEPGRHSLLFRAWDVLNNASTAALDFTVVKSLEPTIFSIGVSQNPATTSTTFIVNQSFAGSNVDVIVDVFDMSGRLLWSRNETATSGSGVITIDWDLCQDNGGRLGTGVYLYRVRVASDGSAQASKAKKLVIINNN